MKLAIGWLHNIFQDLFDKILPQQLTFDKSYIYAIDGKLPLPQNPCFFKGSKFLKESDECSLNPIPNKPFMFCLSAVQVF